jgi:hypothetical protein
MYREYTGATRLPAMSSASSDNEGLGEAWEYFFHVFLRRKPGQFIFTLGLAHEIAYAVAKKASAETPEAF